MISRSSRPEVFWKRKRCSENMQQIYRSLQLHWNHTSAWVFSCKFAAHFKTPFPKNTSEWLPVDFWLLQWLAPAKFFCWFYLHVFKNKIFCEKKIITMIVQYLSRLSGKLPVNNQKDHKWRIASYEGLNWKNSGEGHIWQTSSHCQFGGS